MSQKLFMLCGPSGVGKATIWQAALAVRPDIYISVSHTTRAPRPGEQDGIDYHFVSRDAFMKMADADEFLEWAEYAGNLYGTHRGEIREDAPTLLEIEVQGAHKVKAVRPDTKMIFILPPERKALRDRILARGANNDEELQKRLARAEQELLEGVAIADYFVVNHQGTQGLQWAVDRVVEIIGE